MSRLLLPISWLGLALLTGCGDSDSSGQSDSPRVNGVTDSEIVIGAHTDLTGPIAIWGTGIANGARMRFDEANDAGGIHGRQIRYILEDVQYQVPRAVSAANKLINKDKILAMVMAIGTPTNNAVMVQQFKDGVPNLFPVTGARSMVEPFQKLMFSQMGVYYEEMRAAVRYFIEEKGATTPCVIYQDTDYGQEVLDGVEDQATQMGIEIAAQSAHQPTESEFTAAIIRMREASCDLVLMGTVHRDTVLVLEAARKAGWSNVAWVGNEAAYGQVIADQESGSGEGYYAFVPMALRYADEELSPPLRDWFNRYKDRYDVYP
ncbi:MAG: ABC transporter substrate-binding protein, partial [Pseudomonadota bacterium]|nr:ABC transporter substrate-binding protein [Pseudomonadota bacterium]